MHDILHWLLSFLFFGLPPLSLSCLSPRQSLCLPGSVKGDSMVTAIPTTTEHDYESRVSARLRLVHPLFDYTTLRGSQTTMSQFATPLLHRNTSAPT